MCQQNDRFFYTLLTRARKSYLNNNNVYVINRNIAIIIPITKLDTYIVIIQQDATKHTINRLQMKRFTEANAHNIILFLLVIQE